jgi:hypothetical protein
MVTSMDSIPDSANDLQDHENSLSRESSGDIFYDEEMEEEPNYKFGGDGN